MESKAVSKCNGSSKGGRDHVKSAQKRVVYPCPICSKTLLSRRSLNSHTKVHRGQLDHKCTICNKAFVTKNLLADHRRIHLEQKKHKCNLCQKEFLRKSDLIRHLITHTGEKPYKCSLCSACFRLSGHLKNHQQTHLNLQLYFCPQCPRKYKRKGELQRHSKSHLTSICIPVYDCVFCKSLFYTYTSYSKHIMDHVGETKVFCELCNRSFLSTSNKNTHIRRHHTLERPDSCEICDVRFTTKYQVKQHSITHLPPNTPKPHTCIFCNKGFLRIGSLFRHIKCHIKEMPA